MDYIITHYPDNKRFVNTGGWRGSFCTVSFIWG